MANVKQFVIGGVTYPCEDETARAALAGKQDVLTFDSQPTEGSNNPVKSGGLYSALAGKADAANLSALSGQVSSLGTALSVIAGAATDATAITATFDQGAEWVYAGDDLESLRQYLTVTATLSNNNTITVDSYTLSGTLTAGVSTITVVYGLLTTTFNVNVTGVVPAGYTRFDFIEPRWEMGKGGNNAEAGAILTKKYPNLQDYSLNLLFGHSLGTSLGTATDKVQGFVLAGGGSSANDRDSFEVNVSITGSNITMGVKVTTHGKKSERLSADLPVNTKHRLVYTNTASSPSSFRVDGGTSESITWGTTNAANSELVVCGRRQDGQNAVYAGVQCGEFELTALDGTIVGHYIPCVRNSDYVIGVYEVVEGVFYTSTDVSMATVDHANCAYFVGNWAEAAKGSGVDYTHYTKELVAAYNIGNMQAFDTYAGRVFTLRHTGNGRICVIDLSTGAPIADYVSNLNGHGNGATFRQVNGIVKADESDKFPLLVADGAGLPTGENPASGSDIANVDDKYYNIYEEMRVTETSCTIYRSYLLQKNKRGFGGGFAIDEATKIGYSVGHSIFSDYDPRASSVISKWDMADLTDNGDGTYTPAFLSSVTGPNCGVLQGIQLHDGLLWAADGRMNVSAKIHILDPDTGAQVHVIDLGVEKEIEGVAWLNDREMLVGYAGGIFEKLTFAEVTT